MLSDPLKFALVDVKVKRFFVKKEKNTKENYIHKCSNEI